MRTPPILKAPPAPPTKAAAEPTQIDRIEAMLRQVLEQQALLLALLVDEDDAAPSMTLDGEPIGEERLPGTPL